MTCRSHFLSISIVSCAALLVFGGQRAAAQDQNANRASVVSQTQVPDISPDGVEGGHAVSSPNDPDLGEQEILKRAERYQPFTFSAGVPIYWTSNVALSRSNEKGDVVIAPVAGIYYEPRITQTLYGFVDVRDQQFYYGNYDGFDFGAFDVDVGFSYIMPQLDNLILRLQYNYERLMEKDSFDDFFSNNSIILNAELPVRFGRSQQVSFGTTANISFAAAQESPRRNDYEVYVGYTASLTRSFSLNAVGRFVVRDYYHQDSRVDVNEILSLTATYQINKFFTASAISSVAASQSNHSVFDYNVANLGGALSFAVKF